MTSRSSESTLFAKVCLSEYMLTLLFLNATCHVLANSVAPDQLASEEANWSGSALFVIKYVNYQKPGSSNLTGWKSVVWHLNFFSKARVKYGMCRWNSTEGWVLYRNSKTCCWSFPVWYFYYSLFSFVCSVSEMFLSSLYITYKWRYSGNATITKHGLPTGGEMRNK